MRFCHHNLLCNPADHKIQSSTPSSTGATHWQVVELDKTNFLGIVPTNIYCGHVAENKKKGEGMSELSKFISCSNIITIDNKDSFWETFNSFLNTKGTWIFKGVKVAYDKNKKKLSKGALKTKIEEIFDSYDIEDKANFENNLIRKFKRQCHHYTVPGGFPKDFEEDRGYLLSLMRHYGAPVRLIDWTYSFFVAAYFSLCRIIQKDVKKEYGVWAINDSWLGNTVQQEILFPEFQCNNELKKYICGIENDEKYFTFKNPQFFKRVYFDDPHLSFVHSHTPFHLNDRLVIQQGLFLCPGDIEKSFEENLTSVFNKSNEKDVYKNFKLILFKKEPDDNREKIMTILQRMNINQATLFPGLQGFSESLIEYANYPKILLSEGSEMVKLYKDFCCQGGWPRDSGNG